MFDDSDVVSTQLLASTRSLPTSLGQGQVTGPTPACAELDQLYQAILAERKLSWTSHLQLKRRLGSGGQGVVFLSERRGADGFTLPVALKAFSPAPYATPEDYDQAMLRIGHVASRIAQIQHDNLLVIQNFLDRNRIRLMIMEWVEGLDLKQLLSPELFHRAADCVPTHQWQYVNSVVMTGGQQQPRFKPGAAIAIVRECLSGLAALHREGVVHGDIKPANIMLKRTGRAKIIDFGSAFEVARPLALRACTPAYAALEVLEGGEITPLSDLASLGYVLVELMAGSPVLSSVHNVADLIRIKRGLADRLDELLPREVVVNNLLMSFCRRLVAPDPARRFPSAEAADLVEGGAAAFHRQLVKSDLASEYTNDLRVWMEMLLDSAADE